MKCRDCSLTSKYKQSITRHWKKVHGGGLTITCEKCGENFSHFKYYDHSCTKERILEGNKYPAGRRKKKNRK